MSILLSSLLVGLQLTPLPENYQRGSYDPWGILPNPMLKLERSIDDREYDEKFAHSADWLLDQYQQTGKIESGHAYI